MSRRCTCPTRSTLERTKRIERRLKRARFWGHYPALTEMMLDNLDEFKDELYLKVLLCPRHAPQGRTMARHMLSPH